MVVKVSIEDSGSIEALSACIGRRSDRVMVGNAGVLVWLPCALTDGLGLHWIQLEAKVILCSCCLGRYGGATSSIINIIITTIIISGIATIKLFLFERTYWPRVFLSCSRDTVPPPFQGILDAPLHAIITRGVLSFELTSGMLEWSVVLECTLEQLILSYHQLKSSTHNTQ